MNEYQAAVRKPIDAEPSMALVEAVAAFRGTDPLGLADEDLVLYEYLDPQALDDILLSVDGSGLSISLQIDEMRVRIDDRTVEVKPVGSD